MRILNQSTSEEIKKITLYLEKEEAKELLDSLPSIIEQSQGNHAHVSDNSFKREVTICVYEDGKLEEFDEASRSILSTEN